MAKRKRKKIRIDENDSVNFEETTPSLKEEIATRNVSLDYSGLSSILPDPDPVLRKAGKDFRIYKSLSADSHVFACMQSRKYGVQALEWGIDRYDAETKSEQAKFIEDIFKRLPLHDIMGEILDCRAYGFKPLEIIWDYVGGRIVPVKLVGKPPEWFCFDSDNVLKFKTKANPMGQYLDDKKFLLAQSDPTYNNPYGERYLSRCFWPVFFKKNGMKYWGIFTERFGMDFLTGKIPRGASKEEQQELLDMLSNMLQDAVAVIPDDSSVAFEGSCNKTASADIYKGIIETMNAEISKAILGQTLTTEIGATGGAFAASQTHFAVRQDLLDADVKIIESVFNQLIRWIYELNFGTQGECPEFSMWKEEDVDAALANRDKTLVETGVRFTKKYYVENYGLKEDDFELAPPTTAKPTDSTSQQPQTNGTDNADFAEFQNKPKQEFPGQLAVDELGNSITDETMQQQMETVLKPVFRLFKEASSYNEILEKLAKLFPKMRSNDLEGMLEKYMFATEVQGLTDDRN